MSKIALEGNASGTGTFTVAAPNSSSNFTLTLPTNTGTIITQNSTPAFASTIGVGGATAAASGAGITFPATVSASSDANTLDDYEEGTWTPATVTSGYTISSSSGVYTKVGRLVHCRFIIRFSAVGAGNSSVSITGFPFTNSSVATPGSGRDNSTTGAIYVCSINDSATSGDINSYSGIANGSARTFTTSENYIFSITYQI
jgi:hypothetical protein